MLDTFVYTAELLFGYGESSHVGIFGSLLGAQRGCEVHAGGNSQFMRWTYPAAPVVNDDADYSRASHPEHDGWTYRVMRSHVCRRYDADGEFCTVCDVADAEPYRPTNYCTTHGHEYDYTGTTCVRIECGHTADTFHSTNY